MKVVIQMYSSNPPVRPSGDAGSRPAVWCMTGWDHNCEEAAEIAGGDEGVARAYDRMVMGANLWGDIPLPIGPDPSISVYWLQGSNEAFMTLVNDWAVEIQSEVENVGGDDSHYDYFPDYVNGFRQLCTQLNLEEAIIAFNETLITVVSSETYRDDEETSHLFDPPIYRR